MGQISLAVLLTTCITISTGANILGVFYFPSKSHHILGSALFKELASRGHNVTYVSSFPIEENVPNLTLIKTYELVTLSEEDLKKMRQGKTSLFEKLGMFKKSGMLTRELFNHPNIKWLLGSDSKFDLMINFMGFDASSYFGHHFDVPVIGFVPVGGFPVVNDITGNTAPFSYVPSIFAPLSDEMNFFGRMLNVIISIVTAWLVKSAYVTYGNELIQEFFPNSPPIEKLHERIDMILVNSHVSTETPRPYVPNMVQIGGFHLQEKEVLSKELQDYLDKATEGVVYFSFGTNVKVTELPQEKIDVLKSTLGKIPKKILWKYELDEMPNKPKNVKLGSWFPQRAVLAHPNVKLFISHGGYGGCTESLYFGVPMVCIPFFGDQLKNCAEATISGYAESITVDELTESKFTAVLTKVLHNSSFIENAKFKSDLYRNQPINPMDKAIFWIEHVVKHKGAKHLKVKALNLSWYQYYLLDVLSFLVLMPVIVFYVTVFCCKVICRKVCKSKDKIKTN